MKRILQALIKIILILLVFIVTSLTTLIVLLQTEYGTTTALNLTTKLCDRFGIYIRMTEARGHLPQHLTIKGLSISDNYGEWVRADEVELDLNLWYIFTKTVKVNSVRLVNPVMERLPEQALRDKIIDPNAPAKKPYTGLRLPFTFIVDDIQVDGGLISVNMPRSINALVESKDQGVSAFRLLDLTKTPPPAFVSLIPSYNESGIAYAAEITEKTGVVDNNSINKASSVANSNTANGADSNRIEGNNASLNSSPDASHKAENNLANNGTSTANTGTANTGTANTDVALLPLQDAEIIPLPEVRNPELWPMQFSVNGLAIMSNKYISADISASFIYQDGSGIRLEMHSGDPTKYIARVEADDDKNYRQADKNKNALHIPNYESMKLVASITEPRGGFVATLLGNPDFPAMAALLDANGPYENWIANITATAGSFNNSLAEITDNTFVTPAEFIPADKSLGFIDSTLNAKLSDSTLKLDSLRSSNWSATFRLSALPAAETPEDIAKIVENGAKFDADISCIDGNIIVDIAKLKIDMLEAIVREFDFTMTDEGITLDGEAEAILEDGHLINTYTNKPKDAEPPVDYASVKSIFKLIKTGSETVIKLDGNLEANLLGESLPLSFNIDFEAQQNRLRLNNLNLHGLGLEMTGAGGIDPTNINSVLTVHLLAKNNSPWRAILTRLSGSDTIPDGNLEFNLLADLSSNRLIFTDGSENDATSLIQDDISEEFYRTDPFSEIPNLNAEITVTGNDVDWRNSTLQGLLGSKLSVNTVLSNDSLTRFFVQELKINSAHFKADATASFNPSITTAKLDEGFNHTFSLSDSMLNFNLNTNIDSLKESNLGIEGALLGNIKAVGMMKGLMIKADLTSNKLTMSTGSFTDASISINGLSKPLNGKNTGNDAISYFGTFKTSFADSPSGPLALNAGWQVDQSALGLAIKLSKLQGNTQGINLAGNFAANIPTSANMSIDGSLDIEISDWSGLAALSGSQIQGEPSYIKAQLNNEHAEQNGLIELEIPRVYIASNGVQELELTAIKGTANLQDIFNDAPNITANIVTGAGMAGQINWNQGNIDVNTDNDNIAFKALFLPKDLPPPPAGGRPRGQGGNRQDMAFLGSVYTTSRNSVYDLTEDQDLFGTSGSINMVKQQVTIERLFLFNTASRVGLKTEAPMHISYKNGLLIDDINLSVSPKGSVTGKVALAPNSSNASIIINGLSTEIGRILTDGDLPEGYISAVIFFKQTGGRPSGFIQSVANLSQPSGTTNAPPKYVTIVFGSSLQAPASYYKALIPREPGITLLSGFGGIYLPTTADEFAITDSEPGKTSILQRSNKSTTKQATLRFDLPMRISPAGIPQLVDKANMGLDFDWEGDVAPLWAIVPLADRYLTGFGTIKARVRGNMLNPVHTAEMYFTDGAFEDRVNGVFINNIKLEMHSNNETTTALLSATDGDQGKIAAELSLLSGKRSNTHAAMEPIVNGRVHITNLEPLHRDDLFVKLSGIVNASGPLNAPNIVSKIVVQQGDLDIASFLGPSVHTLDIVDPDAAPPPVSTFASKCDISILIPGRFFVRGLGLDSEWKGNLDIQDALDAPQIVGKLQPVRGTFELLSRQFTLSSGEISFAGGDKVNPAFNLPLTYIGPNITAIMTISGTANKPKIVLDSQPSMPQDQILAQILFGKEPSNLSRFEALQLATGLHQLADPAGSLDLLGSFRRELGIDTLRIGDGGSNTQRDNFNSVGMETPGARSSGDSDRDSSPTLEAGKYIDDTIYVGVEQGITEDSTGVRVEIELAPRLNFQARTTANSSEVGIGWKRDY